MITNQKRNRVGAGLAALVAIAIGSAGLSAGSAAALVTQTDTFKIQSNGYDLGGGGFTNGSPDNPARVVWDHGAAGAVPTLSGRIHFEGVANGCARVKLISYDRLGARIGTDFSDTECAPTNGHHSRLVRKAGGDLNGRNGAAEVKVVLQSQNINGTWAKVGARRKVYGPVLDTDAVQINAPRLDFGTGSLVGGNPQGPGELSWNLNAQGLITPHLTGTFYMKNAEDLCGRIRVEHFAEGGAQIATEVVEFGCPTNNSLHTYPVSIGNRSSHVVASVKVILQKKGGAGAWQSVGSQTVELG